MYYSFIRVVIFWVSRMMKFICQKNGRSDSLNGKKEPMYINITNDSLKYYKSYCECFSQPHSRNTRQYQRSNQNITQENFEIFHMKTNITSYTSCMEPENVPHLRPEHGRQLARFLAPLNRQFLPRDANAL